MHPNFNCKSWTYITAQGQCRLKRSVPDAHNNPCCVSGVKQAAAIAPTAEETECANFANEAVDANAQNLRSRCGLTGPTWSNSYDDVYSHCLDSSPGRRHREADDRSQALQACKQVAEISTKLACDHYARMAVVENQTNEQNHCGFAGPQWSNDLEQHARFCAGA